MLGEVGSYPHLPQIPALAWNSLNCLSVHPSIQQFLMMITIQVFSVS